MKKKLFKLFGLFCVLFFLVGCQNNKKFNLTIELDDKTLTMMVDKKTKVCEMKPEKNNSTFLYWLKDGNICNEEFEIDSDTTIKAVFEEKKTEVEISKYKITFNTDGGTSITSQTITEGNKVIKPSDPTKEGYVFEYWALNGKEYDFTKEVTGSFELKAVYTKEVSSDEDVKSYKVSFNSSGGTKVSSQTIKENGKVSKPSNPTKDGYEFVAWTLNGKTYDFNNKITSNITLIATWKEKEVVKTYTIGITKVDEYSPDRYITVYENGTAIKVSKLMYTDGVVVQAAINGTKLSVSNNDIIGETEFKVQLTDGSVVTAKVK